MFHSGPLAGKVCETNCSHVDQLVQVESLEGKGYHYILFYVILKVIISKNAFEYDFLYGVSWL